MFRPFTLGSLNEASRQTEVFSPFGFEAAHGTAVPFVVVAEEMKKAVEDQDFDFGGDIVAEANGLFKGAIGGDGYFAEFGFAGKTEHISRVVVLEESKIETLEFLIVGDEYGEGLTGGDFEREAGDKSAEAGLVERDGPFDALE